tara:strand:- start:2554 stop:2703 length:150 start_codon:yes stop_codon:yes gene_type:complete
MTYIEKLNVKMKELRKSDDLSIPQILKMNMYEYNKELVERASEELKTNN